MNAENRSLKALLPIGIITIIFLALLSVATVYDLQISEAIADLNGKNYISPNLFGRVFEVFGEDPVYIISAIGGCFVIMGLPKVIKNKKLFVALKVLLLIIIVFDYTYMTKKVIKYLSEHFDKYALYEGKKLAVWGVSAVFGLVFTAITLFFTSKVKEEKALGLLIWGVIAIATFALSQGFVQGIKPFVGRMRFRGIYVLNENGLSELAKFTKWFEWNGAQTLTEEMTAIGLTSDVFRSFPSGHTCGAAILVTLVFLPKLLGLEGSAYKRWTVLFWTASAVLTVVVAYSRLRMGAHFLSDVSVGGYATYLAAFISEKVVKTLAKKFKLL